MRARAARARNVGTAVTTFEGAGIPLSVGSNATTQISAELTDAAGNYSPCSSPIDYTHDNVYPNVSIDSGPMGFASGPPGLTADSTPTFGFSVDDPTATVECSIYEQGGGPVAYEPCSGPGDTHTPAAPLADGDYTFEVRATDAATNSSGYLNDFTVDTTSLANFGEITVPDEGAATPFPSAIQVSGLDTKISDVNVTLHGLNHGSADDLEIVVVGPTEAAVYLLSDAGGSTGVSWTDPTFDDQAAAQLLDESGGIPTGSHRPTNQTGGQELRRGADLNPGPDPGLADPQQDNCLAETFNGTDPNGQWTLYVYDDTANGKRQHCQRLVAGDRNRRRCPDRHDRLRPLGTDQRQHSVLRILSRRGRDLRLPNPSADGSGPVRPLLRPRRQPHPHFAARRW